MIIASFSSAVVRHVYNSSRLVTCSEGLAYQLKDSLLFVWRRLSNQGTKIRNPKKSRELPTKSQNIPCRIYEPWKFPESKTSLVVHILYLQNCTAGICETTTNLQIVWNPNKYLPNFPTLKNPGIKNFKPQKILWSPPPPLQIWSTPVEAAEKWISLKLHSYLLKSHYYLCLLFFNYQDCIVWIKADCQRVLLEAGCGVGNLCYPLLEEIPNLFIHACDFSQRAVQFVKVSLNSLYW